MAVLASDEAGGAASGFVAHENGLTIRRTRYNGVVRLYLGKELEWRTVAALEELIAEEVRRGFAELVVDLEGLSFIDSTGIKVLVETGRQAAELGRRFGVVNPTGQVRKIFEVTALDSILRYWQGQAQSRAAEDVSPSD